ncbi:MAG: AmpG family muropeptide MFS transporter [Cellvibrionaceae bacterium]
MNISFGQYKSIIARWPLQKVLCIALLGFSAGIPILLIFSTLSLWLSEAGVQKSAVTYFSWAALGYSFKFIWAPVVDKLPLPFVSKMFGRRRAWLLLSQCSVIASILYMASINPSYGLSAMAIGAVALGFSSATQDIVIDAYRIECAEPKVQALLSSSYIAGYRIGMVVAGAGGLYLAYYFGSRPDVYVYAAWQKTYFIMALVMGVGVITTLCISEPNKQVDNAYPYSTSSYVRFFLLFILSICILIVAYRFSSNLIGDTKNFNAVIAFLLVAGQLFFSLSMAALMGFVGSACGFADKKMVFENYCQPAIEFFTRYGRLAIWVLLLVGFYRVSDIVMGVIANVFYQELGYSKLQIANVTKVFGLLLTIAGSFIGGFLTLRWGVIKVLLLGAVLSALTNIAFIGLSYISFSEPSTQALAIVIALDNLSAGLAVAVFIAWLSSLTSISFTATQYAIFSSLMTLFPKLLGGYSGTMVESMGYSWFFIFTALLSVPVIALILYLNKRLSL